MCDWNRCNRVRQGCTLSPLFFNLYDEVMMRGSISNVDIEVKVRGHIVKTVNITDDKTLVASSGKSLQELMHNINRVTKYYEVKLNAKKANVMCITRKERHMAKIYIDHR